MDKPLESPNLPVGTANPAIALVFTDMVGSSAAKRAAELGPDATTRDRAYLANIQAKHLRLVRSAVAQFGGTEVMTIGDSFFLTFEDAVSAMRCAVAIQQGLRSQPIDTPMGRVRLRIGLHFGRPEYFENSWHGTDVDAAARVESLGSPDQILVTEAARRAIGDLPDIKFRPLGTYALKGAGNLRLWDADYDKRGLRHPLASSNEQRRRNRATAALVFLCAAAALCGWGMWRWRQERQAALLAGSAKNSIALAGFENKTGDPIFNDTLKQALAIELEQSPVLSLVSDQHLRQSMGYLGKPPDAPLTPAVIREIGMREGIKAYLAGSIAKLGNRYLISLSAQNIWTGDDIASEEAQARDKDHVLEALDKVSAAVRAKLGESLESVQKLDTPLGQATTPSLEAFRAYALGSVEHERGHDVPDAERYYRQAVQIDPSFAMAWARLGAIDVVSARSAQAADELTKAYRLSGNVSEREKFYIAGHYYAWVLGDLPKVIATLALATRAYPLDVDNYVNLGIAQNSYGQMEQALEPLSEAAKIDPHNAIVQDDILTDQLDLDDLPGAAATMAKERELGIDLQTTSHLRRVLLFDWLKGDQAGIQKVVAGTEGRPDEFQITSLLALTQEFAGHYRDAAASWERGRREVASLNARNLEAEFILYNTLGRAQAGRCAGAVRQVQEALALDKNKATLSMAAFAAGICNHPDVAFPILTNLEQTYSADTLVEQAIIPQTRAALALAAHRPKEALKELQGSKSFDLVSRGAYLRGLTYLQLHDAPEAIDAFQSAIRYRGAAILCCQDYPQAELGLARAYAAGGNLADARRAYQKFFPLWENADPDLPQLAAAKKEFANLH